MSQTTSDWDPLSPENVSNPRDEAKRMRSGCPVAFTEQFGGTWALFKHRDIERAAREPETFSSAPQFVIPDMTGGVFPWLPVQSDPPMHDAYRGLIAPFFRGARLAAFEPLLQRITNERIDEFISDGTVDVASQLNIPVSASGLALLMGLPESDWEMFKRWHYGMVEANAGQDQEALGRTFMEMLSFVHEWMTKRQADPTDDLMSALVTGEVDGRPLTNEEILGTFILLSVGGFETTADTLSSTMQYLSTRPDVCDQLRENPQLLTKAVGEFCRVFAPVQATARVATRDVEIGGKTIKEGDRICMMWASGSRDEEVFPDADECQIDRPTHKLTSFGLGAHRCLGEPLARIEIRAVLSTWLQRIETFDVAGEPEPGLWPTVGWHTMPMKFTPMVTQAS
ncbi:cytochrome P450 [Nocardia nova]|uniref:cytochrome P450 n=1 Tax=Nocardia nova TaxID=37330 RepID=UPI00378DBC76